MDNHVGYFQLFTAIHCVAIIINGDSHVQEFFKVVYSEMECSKTAIFIRYCQIVLHGVCTQFVLPSIVHQVSSSLYPLKHLISNFQFYHSNEKETFPFPWLLARLNTSLFIYWSLAFFLLWLFYSCYFPIFKYFDLFFCVWIGAIY